MNAVLRHGSAIVLTGFLFAVFWASRPEWSVDMRLWRAVGDAAIVLLFATLSLGPLAKLFPGVGRLLPWRRQLGVWAAIIALVHTVLVLNGWAQWSVMRLLGYEFVPELDRTLRLEPGFGLANLMGLVAMGWMLILLATSTDFAVRFLGGQAWKWVHYGAYVVFYLSVLHAAYFLFIHYTASFHRTPPPENWFRFPLLALGAIVMALQIAAFVETVRRRRARLAETAEPPTRGGKVGARR